jgi:hypothetical protein
MTIGADAMRTIFRTALMLSLTCAPAVAQNEPAPGWAPALHVRALASWPQGAQANVSEELRLAKNEPATLTFWTRRSLCQIGGGDLPAAAGAAPQQNVWNLSAEYLGEDSGRHRIRVTSGFTRLDGRDASTTTTQTLALSDGDSVVLDALTGAVDTTCQVHTIVFDAKLVMQATDPSLARTRYAADLWLVHRDPSGQEQREHLVTNLDGDGSAVPFVFTPLTFAIPRLDRRQGNAQAAIRVAGTLHVRTRADGMALIQLEAIRPMYGLDDPDRPPTLSMPPVRMTLLTKTEETVAADFAPPSSGYDSIPLAAGSTTVRAAAGPISEAQPTDAVQMKNNYLILYTFQFFKGHSTRLLITLKRLP